MVFPYFSTIKYVDTYLIIYVLIFLRVGIVVQFKLAIFNRYKYNIIMFNFIIIRYNMVELLICSYGLRYLDGTRT